MPNAELTPEKVLYSRKDAALCLSISLRTLDYLISQRQLITRRIGKKVLVPAMELRKFAKADHPDSPRLSTRKCA